MPISYNKSVVRWLIIALSFIIISLILWNTYSFFQNFKAEERTKMKIWAFAQKELSKTEDLNNNNSELSLALEVITNNTTTPMIIVSNDGSMQPNNIDEEKAKDEAYLLAQIEKFKKENDPIKIVLDNEVLSTLYYGNSPLLNKLKYYPLALLLIIVLFAAVVYFFYRSNKNAEQNKLWTGMAKETAHQIGTPLSSLVGWTEILKSENVNPSYIVEIEKDIDRLQTITDRFSKIGAVPTLKPLDVVVTTKNALDYLQARASKLITFETHLPNEALIAALNEQLYGWTIENLIKNAIDAMKGKGKITINITHNKKHIFITIADTGKGIAKQHFKSIFEPGYTTKKRGWGLGLSLAKRIIEDYHNGKIKVLSSEIGKGTTFQISLKRI